MNLEPLIYVSDLQKSIEFYCDLLGFRLGKLYPNKKAPTYASVFIGKDKLMLCLARKTNRKFHAKGLGSSGAQFFVQVENVNEIWKKVKDRVEILDPIETKAWGDREFTVKDPDGCLISFYSPTK